MKVSDLIAALTLLDPETPVDLEGCDCINPAKTVSIDNGRVLIEADLS